MKKHYANRNENVLNTTIFMHNASYPLAECTSAIEDIYYYYLGEYEYYGSTDNFRNAAIFNMLANTVRIEQLS